MEYCKCDVCNEPDCKVCLEPQHCECNCGTCSDARSMMDEESMFKLPDIDDDMGLGKTNDPDEIECHEMFLENLNDIEKDGQ